MSRYIFISRQCSNKKCKNVEWNKWKDKKKSQFHHLVKGLLRIKTSMRNVKLIFLKFILGECYYIEQIAGPQEKVRLVKVCPWKWNFWEYFKQNEEGQDKKY